MTSCIKSFIVYGGQMSCKTKNHQVNVYTDDQGNMDIIIKNIDNGVVKNYDCVEDIPDINQMQYK